MNTCRVNCFDMKLEYLQATCFDYPLIEGPCYPKLSASIAMHVVFKLRETGGRRSCAGGWIIFFPVIQRQHARYFPEYFSKGI